MDTWAAWVRAPGFLKHGLLCPRRRRLGCQARLLLCLGPGRGLCGAPGFPRPPPTYATDEPVPVVCRVLPLPSRRKANLPLRDVFVLLSLAPLSSMHPFRSPVATSSALE